MRPSDGVIHKVSSRRLVLTAILSPLLAAALAVPIEAFVSSLQDRPAPELSSTTWINSDPLTLQKLRGKVVLLEFWTYG